MKIFVVATRNQDRPAEDFAPLMDPEADFALKLYKEGFIREIYSRTDGKGALVVVEADNEEEAVNKLSDTIYCNFEKIQDQLVNYLSKK